MKKIILLFITLIMVPSNIYALTDNDIINYIESQNACDTSSQSLLETYSLQLKRMLNERELTDEELKTVYNYVINATNILKENNVCKRKDLSLLPSEIKSKVKDYIYSVIDVISSAKAKYENENEKNSSSGIIINDDKTISVIMDNAIIENITLDEKKFNYVGSNKVIIYTIILFCALFIISIILKFMIKNKKFNVFLNSLLLFSISIIFIFYTFSNTINKGINLLSLLKNNAAGVLRNVSFNNGTILRYPSIGTTYASIYIDRLSINEPITYGETKEILSKGVSHSNQSYFPGENKTVILSVHNYKMPELKNIEENDIITIKTDYGVFKYKVVETKIMKDNEYNQISLNAGKEMLVLYTCYPFSVSVYNNQRFVIFSELIESKWESE